MSSEVWGSSRLPFITHFSGCQMCRGHSRNGSWTEEGIEPCREAFMEAFTFADGIALGALGMRRPVLGVMRASPTPSSLLGRRHARLSRCMPRLLVIGTQKGGTSTLHYLLQQGWQSSVRVNKGEKEVHYFSLDDVYARGASRYQQRWDGEEGRLGECPEGEVRAEVSASYFDYPKSAERAAALVPSARLLVLLREPVGRLLSSFNMRWQIELCGKLTWSRRDCYTGLTSRELVRENAVGPYQKAAALKVWSKCAREDKLNPSCLRADFVSKLRNRTLGEMAELERCGGGRVGECLGLPLLPQRKLYKRMEDHAFVYRSAYYHHIQTWLNFYPSQQILVLPSEALFSQASIAPAMRKLADFLQLPSSGPSVNEKVGGFIPWCK